MSTSLSRRRRFGVSVALGGALGVALTVGTAAFAADYDNLVPFVPPGAIEPSVIKQTDNAAVYFYMDSNGDYMLESYDKSVVNNMLDAQYRPTDLSFHYDSTPVFSGSAETDTIWQEGTVSGSAEGRAWCNDTVGAYECDQHYIRIEPGWYNAGITCHEMGHAVGLTHGADAYPSVAQNTYSLRCMRTPTSSGDILGSHNKGQINGAY